MNRSQSEKAARVEIPEVELEIESPLRDCFDRCETECVAGCCGLDAFSSNSILVRAWAASQNPETVATALSQLEPLIAKTQDRSHRVSSDYLNHFTANEPARQKLLTFLERFRSGLSGRTTLLQLTDADRVWNRACSRETWNGAPREGDDALAALLLVHGMVMNGSLAHAFAALGEDDINRGIAGYRFFGLEEHARLLKRARHLNAKEQEALTAEYSKHGEDYELARAFELKFECNPKQFAPL